MTFKDLQKLIQTHSQISSEQNKIFERLKNKPFWIWNIEEHKLEDARSKGDCCFNHIIGLPKKDQIDKPIYDYEKIIFDSSSSSTGSNDVTKHGINKHLWIKKATGLGITEFMLRYMAWLCVKDDTLTGSQMCIVTGPRIDLAITLIDRLKRLFTGIAKFANKETVIELNGVRIEAFPSHHLDSMRGLPNVSFILLDEADFFPPGQQQDARDVSERYIGKSNPYIVMVSTPNAPDGLFEKIEKESEDSCIYKRLLLDYTYGLDRIYSKEEIDKAKQSPSFEREYNLKYLGHIGTVFHTKDIEAAIERGSVYDPDPPKLMSNSMAPKSMGIDPAWGSSAFGIVVTQLSDNQVQVLHAEEYHRPDFNEMLKVIWESIRKCGDMQKFYIDGANPSFIKALKLQLGEDPDYEKGIARYRDSGWDDIRASPMRVIPVNFSTEHKKMLGHTKFLLEDGKIAINPKFTKLITSLRTAVDIDGVLDKKATSYNDIFDAYRLSLQNVIYEGEYYNEY